MKALQEFQSPQQLTYSGEAVEVFAVNVSGSRLGFYLLFLRSMFNALSRT